MEIDRGISFASLRGHARHRRLGVTDNGPASSPLDPSPTDQTQGRELVRVSIYRRGQGDAIAEGNFFGPLRGGGEEPIRCAEIIVMFEELMLHSPGKIDFQFVSKLDLIQRLMEDSGLGILVPE